MKFGFKKSGAALIRKSQKTSGGKKKTWKEVRTVT